MVLTWPCHGGDMSQVLRDCTGCELDVLPREKGHLWKEKISEAPNPQSPYCYLHPVHFPLETFFRLIRTCPNKETRQYPTRGCWRGRVRQAAPGIDVLWV